MKRIASLIITAALFCTALFAKENLFSFSLGLSSGFPILRGSAGLPILICRSVEQTQGTQTAVLWVA